MRTSIVLTLMLVSSLAYSNDVRWEKEPAFKIDLDCDGKQDDIYLGYVGSDFLVKAMVSSQEKSSRLQFGLSQPSRQDAICGSIPKLGRFETSPEMFQEIFGEVPEGYEFSPQCSELEISGGECDSIHIFWNHKTKEMNWWRM